MRRVLLVALLAACGGDDAPAVDAPTAIDAAIDASSNTVVYVVRHAETAGAGSDPQLSPAGLARAANLATLLANAHIGAVYTSQYVRTHDTGVPTADAAAITITTQPVDGVADGMELVTAVAAGGAHAVLIVGHSNTVPETVLAFTGTTVAPIAETEYDRIYTITLAPDGPHVVAGTY